MKNNYRNQLFKKNIEEVCKCLTFIFLLLSFIFCMNNAGKMIINKKNYLKIDFDLNFI